MQSPIDRRKADYFPIRDRFNLLGARVLGAGWYGLAFDRGDRVLKLTFCPAQLAYSKLAMQHPKEGFFPRVYSAVEQVGLINGFSVHAIEQERLENIFGSRAGMHGAGSGKAAADFLEEFLMVHGLAGYAVTKDKETGRLSEPEYEALVIEKLARHPVSEGKRGALTKLAQLVRQNELTLDMLPQNFMRRSNGDIVMVDPVHDPRTYDAHNQRKR